MGRGIIYCGECGKRLLESDLAAGRGGYLQNIPFCVECRPGIAKPPSGTSERPSLSSTRLRAGAPAARPHLPARPVPRRRTALLWAGLAAAGVVLAALAVALSGPTRPAGTPPAPALPPPSRPPSLPAPREDVVAALEAFARTEADPRRVLIRCDEARRAAPDPVSLGRIAAVEQAALAADKARAGEERLRLSMEEVRKLMASDRGFAREEEVFRLLDALAAAAGPRRPEVEALRAEYADHLVLGRLARARTIRESEAWLEREQEALGLLDAAGRRESPHRARVAEETAAFARHRWEARRSRARELVGGAPDLARLREARALLRAAMEVPGAPREALAAERDAMEKAHREAALAGLRGPYELDPNGYVQHWLLLGPFPNPVEGDAHRGYDADPLGGEGAHAAAEGIEVGALAWRRFNLSGERLDFNGLYGQQDWVITYAACVLESDADQAVEIRLGSDDGFKLWVDGTLVGSEHAHRENVPDSNRFPVRLSKGRHRLLLKVEQGDGGYGFMLRVVRPDGTRPSGVRVRH